MLRWRAGAVSPGCTGGAGWSVRSARPARDGVTGARVRTGAGAASSVCDQHGSGGLAAVDIVLMRPARWSGGRGAQPRCPAAPRGSARGAARRAQPVDGWSTSEGAHLPVGSPSMGATARATSRASPQRRAVCWPSPMSAGPMASSASTPAPWRFSSMWATPPETPVSSGADVGLREGTWAQVGRSARVRCSTSGRSASGRASDAQGRPLDRLPAAGLLHGWAGGRCARVPVGVVRWVPGG